MPPVARASELAADGAWATIDAAGARARALACYEGLQVKIRPFRISIPDSELLGLKCRLERTRWTTPIREAGWTLGMDLGFLRSLADYWLNGFDNRVRPLTSEHH